VSDLTLISKITNEAINDNLKKRFENAEIYVRIAGSSAEGREGVR
jgi:myosin-1